MATDYNDPEVLAEAKRKLSELYAISNRQQRIQLGRGLGYDQKRVNPDSARRSAARLASFRLGKGVKLDVTRFFQDYITFDEWAEGKNAWKGSVPPYVMEPDETFYLTSTSLIVKSEQVDFVPPIGIEAYITPSFHSRDIESLFAAVDGIVDSYFDGSFQPMKGTVDNYRGVIAIGISEEGVQYLERLYDLGALPREIVDGKTQFKVSLVSSAVRKTRTKYKKDRKALPRTSAPAARDFPRTRRKEIVQYINRSYGQRVRRYGQS